MGYLKAQIIVGRLGTEPVLSEEEGLPVCRFPVGTSLLYRRGGETIRETEWHPVAVYGERAKEVARALRKGGEVYVKGPWRTVSYTVGTTNVPRIRTEVIAQDVKWPGMGQPGLLHSNKLPDHIVIGDAPDGEAETNAEVIQTGLRIENLGAGLITASGGVARSNAPGVGGDRGAGGGRFKGGAGSSLLGGLQLSDTTDEDDFATGFISAPVDPLAELQDLSARIGTGQDTYFGRKHATGAMPVAGQSGVPGKDSVGDEGDEEDEDPNSLMDDYRPSV